jgi:hypothetical protein
VPVDVVDLLLKALVEHLIRLVKNEHLDSASPKVSSLNHVKRPPWCPRNDVLCVGFALDEAGVR